MHVVVEDQNMRPYMEDTHLSCDVRPFYKLFGVFDGHGGGDIAELCRHNFGHILEQCIQKQPYDLNLCIRQTFLLLDNIAFHCQKPTVGSTAVILLASPERLWFANAGDSMAMIAYMDGTTELCSIEHKVEAEKIRISSSGGIVTYWDGVARVNGTLNVSRSIGDHHQKKYVISIPYIKSIKIKNKAIKYVIIASDGIWDVMDCRYFSEAFKEAYEYVCKSMSIDEQKDSRQMLIEKTLVNMVALAKSLGSGDNITILYVDGF